MFDPNADNFFEETIYADHRWYKRFPYQCIIYWASNYQPNMDGQLHYHQRTLAMIDWMTVQYGPYSKTGNWHVRETWGKAHFFFVLPQDYMVFKLTYS